MFRFRFSRFCREGLPRTALLVLAAASILSSTGCLPRRKAKASRRTPPPTLPGRPGEARAKTVPAPIIQGEEGIASWYGRPFHGRRTASGEVFNMHDMTAAHKTLPFGTQVRVQNLENAHDVLVRINDRGPFVEGRIIDLSYAAAQRMRMPGTALVRLEILGLASSEDRDTPPGTYAVQVGAFKDRRNAQRLKEVIALHYGPISIQSFDRGDGLFHRVRVGRENSEEAARDLARQLRRSNLATETFVVRLN